MQTIIVICLLVVIFLLIEDKVVTRKKLGRNANQASADFSLPEIMGLSKPSERLLKPKNDSDSQDVGQVKDSDNLAHEITRENNSEREIPQEGPEEAPDKMVDYVEEEREWDQYRFDGVEDGFASGVTFEELSAVGMMLQQDVPEPFFQAAADTVRKIHGTELFQLLEDSIEGASVKMAALLDRSLANADSGSSILRKKDLGDFDIGEFV